MTTLWLNRICAYRSLKISRVTARNIIQHKAVQQYALLKLYHAKKVQLPDFAVSDVQSLLLAEGRYARHYWMCMKALLPSWTGFTSRKPRSNDCVNKLLDIGYHHLSNSVERILKQHHISSALGLIHRARTERSKPLVYDLMELFRADLVDREMIKFIKLKKRPIKDADQKIVGQFLHRINTRMTSEFYVKEFRQCQSYQYITELQILKFVSAVNHKHIFEPIVLPSRHDMRCRRRRLANEDPN